MKVAAPAHPCARGISESILVIANIEDPLVIEKFLAHVRNADSQEHGFAATATRGVTRVLELTAVVRESESRQSAVDT